MEHRCDGASFWPAASPPRRCRTRPEAQATFPSKQVHLIVPTSAGGVYDVERGDRYLHEQSAKWVPVVQKVQGK